MIWLTWRQHRGEVLIMGIILAVFATILLVTGLSIAAEAQNVGATRCVGHQTTCFQAQATLANYIHYTIMQNSVFTMICILLPLILPVLAGMFIGAPAIAREFEHGTYRLIWTQSRPWSHWFFNKVSLLSCVVVGAFSMLFGLFTWWNAPILSMPLHQGGSDFSTFFDNWGMVAVAYAFFALMLGIFTGTVLRKTVPAMAMTLVIFVIVRILIVNFWRPYYLSPVVAITPLNATAQIPTNAWVMSIGIVDQHGQPASPEIANVCNTLDPTQYNRCVVEHGLQNKTVYQPADRYWPLQTIESGIYLLMTVVLCVLTLWWMKYRIIGTEKRKTAEGHHYVSA